MTSATTMTSENVNPEIYAKSGDMNKHLEGVKKQYDTQEKRAFYQSVMGDGTANIHFGKWDNIDLETEGAYGRASEQMTDYMYNLATTLLGRSSSSTISYVDLGSGTGGAAVRLLQKHPSLQATCLNLCPEQNATAQTSANDNGVADRFQVHTGTYEEAPLPDSTYDISFSQDAFVHAFSKVKTYSEALRLTKPGGIFIFCDLMCGNGPDVSDDELATFAATNMVNDWLTPKANVKACEQAGWKEVKYIDLTSDIRISFQLMLKKVQAMIARGGDGIDMVLLKTYEENLTKRVTQVDRGVFQWGVIHAKKSA